jgi:ABC-type glycerol-3-phosphate transport system permease component
MMAAVTSPLATTQASVASEKKTDRTINIVVLVILIAGSLIMLLPFAWMLSTSLKQPSEIFTYPIQWIPQQLRFENYVEAMTALPFPRFFFNSFLVAIVVTILDLFTSSLAGFAFARLRFKGRDALFVLYLATLMIPSQVTLIPSFILIRALGWYDTYPALIVPFISSAFSTFLLRQQMRSIPVDLDEAARLDGAGSLRVWWHVALPLVAPALAALATLTFLAQWNSFLWPLMVTTSLEMRTVPVGLQTFQGRNNTQWHLLMAAAVIALLPVLIIYLVAQKWIVEAVSLSGGGGK